MNTERRLCRRFEAKDLRGDLLFKTPVAVKDISSSGMRFEATERIELNRSYHVRFFVEEGTLELEGTIVQCWLSGTHKSTDGDVLPCYRAGMQFEPFPNQKAERLIDLLHEDSAIGTTARLASAAQDPPLY